MPPLEMRGRYLMREYWTDSDLFTKLTAEGRELYVGMWMLADDLGWMPRDITGIGAALYRFESVSDRESRVRAGIDRLRRLGKVESHRCGCLFLPAVARYPRAGKKNAVHAQKHQTHSNGFGIERSKSQKDLNAIQTDLNPSPVPSLPNPTRRARARGEFKERMAANGLKDEP